MEKYIHKQLIGEISIDDLDWSLQNEFGGADYEDIDFCFVENGNYNTDSHIINIDTMIGELHSMKAKGATHVAIDYHCDHIGYDITGFLVKEATDEEINKYLSERELEKQREIKRLDLIKQLEQLSRKVQPINTDDLDLPF